MLISPSEFKEQWHRLGKTEIYSLLTIPDHVLEDLNIPEDAKRFLSEAGVPDSEYLATPVDINLTRLPDVPRKPNYYPGTKHLPASYKRYRVFGDALLRHYACLDEEQGGRIVYVNLNTAKSRELRSEEERDSLNNEDIELFDIEDEDIEALFDKMEMPISEEDEDEPIEPIVYFVNSSIQQLAMCWLLATKYAELVETVEVWHDDILRNKYADLWEEEIRRTDAAALYQGCEWAEKIHSVRRGLIS